MKEESKTKITIRDIETGRRHNAKSLALRSEGRYLKLRNSKVVGERTSTGMLFKYKKISCSSSEKQHNREFFRGSEPLKIEPIYRAIKSKEIVEKLKNKVKSIRENNNPIQIHKPKRVTDALKEVEAECADAIITKIPKDLDAIYDLIVSTQHVLKKEGLAVAFINQALLRHFIKALDDIPYYYNEKPQLYYIWTLSFRLPVIDPIGDRLWRPPGFSYWCPAVLFGKRDPGEDDGKDIILAKDIITPLKPHKNYLLNFGFDLEVYKEVTKILKKSNVLKSNESKIYDPFCTKGSFFSALSEDLEIIGVAESDDEYEGIENTLYKEELTKEITPEIQKKWGKLDDKFVIAMRKLEIQDQKKYKSQEEYDKYISLEKEAFIAEQTLLLYELDNGFSLPAIINCWHCEGRFLTKIPTERYCSNFCRRKGKAEIKKTRRLQELSDRVCPICSKTFDANRGNNIFCSNACKQKNYRKSKQKQGYSGD